MFKGKIKSLESDVVNLDNKDGEGTHFTALYNDPNSEHIEYFDSFGVFCPKQIAKYLRTSNKKIVYNDSQYQPFPSKYCGWYCCYYINERSRGISQYDVLAKLNLNDLDSNDKFIMDYAVKHFNFFLSKK